MPIDITPVGFHLNAQFRGCKASSFRKTPHCLGNRCPALLWRHNGCGSITNHQPHDCLLNRLFSRRSKKTSNLRVTGLFAGNGPVNSPHKWPVMRKSFPFDDVVMGEWPLERVGDNFDGQIINQRDHGWRIPIVPFMNRRWLLFLMKIRLSYRYR